MGRPTVFLSDLGVRDEFAGVYQCVIERGPPPHIAVYHDVPEDEYGVLLDSWGWVSVIRYTANAAEGLEADRGELVWLRPA